jgi:hypothetical protein
LPLGGAGVEADQPSKFRVFVQANKVGISGCPIAVAVPGGKTFLEGFKRFGFFLQDAVGASGVVESAGITWTKSHGGLQVAYGFIFVFFERGKLGSQQDAGPHVFRHNLELLAEGLDKSFGDVVCLLLPPKAS